MVETSKRYRVTSAYTSRFPRKSAAVLAVVFIVLGLLAGSQFLLWFGAVLLGAVAVLEFLRF